MHVKTLLGLHISHTSHRSFAINRMTKQKNELLLFTVCANSSLPSTPFISFMQQKGRAVRAGLQLLVWGGQGARDPVVNILPPGLYHLQLLAGGVSSFPFYFHRSVPASLPCTRAPRNTSVLMGRLKRKHCVTFLQHNNGLWRVSGPGTS